MIYLGENPIGLAYNQDKYDYEEGIYIPTEDIVAPTINFTTNHSTRPLMIILADMIDNSAPSENSILTWQFIDPSQYVVAGEQLYVGSFNTGCSGVLVLLMKMSTSLGMTTSFLGELHSNGARDVESYVTLNGFIPHIGSTYYLQAGRIYKWLAIWNKQEVTSNANE